jgi:hypothetical protein
MFTTKVDLRVEIAHPDMLRTIKSLSPAHSLLDVTMGIRKMLKKDRPEICDLQICRQIAKSAIDQGFVHMLPPADVHNEIVARAPACTDMETMLRAAAEAYALHDVDRPTLHNLRGLLTDMVAQGDLVIGPQPDLEADLAAALDFEDQTVPAERAPEAVAS